MIQKWLTGADPSQKRAAGNILKFLAVLLVLTFVARGASGATLARVELASPMRSEIVDAVSGSAIVTAVGTTYINAIDGLLVAQQLVTVGQSVEVGDPLLIFDMQELEERKVRETATLAGLQLDYQRIKRGDDVDTGSITTAQLNLSRAQEDYAALRQQNAESVADAISELDRLLDINYHIQNGNGENGYSAEAMPSQMRNHQRAIEDWQDTFVQGEADIAAAIEAAQSVDDTAVQNALRTHARALEDYNATVAQWAGNIADAQAELDEIMSRRPQDMDRSALDTAQRNYERARYDYNATRRQGEEGVRTAEEALSAAIWAYNNAVNILPPGDAAIYEARTQFLQAKAAVDTAQAIADANLLTRARHVEDTRASLNQAQQAHSTTVQGELERAQAALDNAITQAEDSHSTAARRLEDAEIGLVQATSNFDTAVQNAQDAIEAARTRAADNLAGATRRLEDAAAGTGTEIERAQSNLQTVITNAESQEQTARRRIEDARTQLVTAEQNHARSIAQNADTVEQNSITAPTLALDIQAQYQRLDIVSGLIATNGVLYASHAGIVSIIVAQNAVTTGAAAVTLRDVTGGFEAEMLVNASTAERIRVGHVAEVTTGASSIFFTPTTDAIVSAVSTPNENNDVTITMTLPGSNWTTGQRIDAEITFARANYDLSVPISAINSDNAGYFVNIVESQSTVLGIQNVVQRVNVSIVASDSEMAAVRGPVTRECMVVIGANKPISQGSRVR